MASIQRIGFTQSQNDLSKIFKALGHPARLAIIDTLLTEHRIICKELNFEIPLSQSTVSKHLQVLFESGLLGSEKEANVTYYIINPLEIDKARTVLSSILTSANEKDYNYKSVIFEKLVPQLRIQNSN